MQDDSWGLNGEFDDIDMDEGAEATGGRAAVQTVPVLFRVAASHARPGGRVPLRVIVFGSVPELGGWKVQQGVAMETDAGEFPVFSAEVALPVLSVPTSSVQFYFKFQLIIQQSNLIFCHRI